jgi:hypothetical protein
VTEPTNEELLATVRRTLNRGSYEPRAAKWQAHFDDISRDQALTALDTLAARLEAAERRREQSDLARSALNDIAAQHIRAEQEEHDRAEAAEARSAELQEFLNRSEKQTTGAEREVERLRGRCANLDEAGLGMLEMHDDDCTFCDDMRAALAEEK